MPARARSASAANAPVPTAAVPTGPVVAEAAAPPAGEPTGAVDGARAMSRLSRHVERALRPLELSVAQFRVLDVLSLQNEGGRALAEWLAVKPASVTTVVDGLVARGLVERRGDPADRRRVSHELTSAGRELHGTACAVVAERLAGIAAFADPGIEPDDLLATLSVWARALDRARDANRAARAAAAAADEGRSERRG